MTRRPFRVARVITRLNVGGPAIQAMLLTARLDPTRFTSTLIAGAPGEREGDMSEIRPVAGVRPVPLRTLRRRISPVDDARSFFRLFRWFRAERPDLVHTHLAKAGALGRLAARAAGVPVVVHTFHGNVLSGYFGARTSRAFTSIERALASASDRLIAISPAQARELAARGIGAGKVEVIPLGFDLRPFREARAGGSRHRYPGEGPIVGIVARLVPIKRVDLFIEAARIVGERVADARFVVVGDGPLRGELERAAATAGLGPRLRFVGWESDVAAVYADLDVLVCCSDNEGTPVSVIEAMASGTPVVATSVGGVPDIVREGEGRLVPPGDAVALGENILGLLADPARSAIGRRGRDRVLREHDVDVLVARIEELYVRLLRARGIDAAPS